MKTIEQIREKLVDLLEDRQLCAMDAAGYEKSCLDGEIAEIRLLQSLEDGFILEFIEKEAKSGNPYNFDYGWFWKWINE